MNPDSSEQVRRRRPLWKRLVLLVVFCGLALGVVVVSGAIFVIHTISRLEINIDGQALSDALNESIRMMLREGTDEQRLDLIGQLEQAGPQAKPFVPHLLEVARDPDPAIREAALRALRQIDPESLDASEPM